MIDVNTHALFRTLLGTKGTHAKKKFLIFPFGSVGISIFDKLSMFWMFEKLYDLKANRHNDLKSH